MARFIPCTFDSASGPNSERIVFDALKKHLSDDWTVFHGFRFLRLKEHFKRGDAEIDFLLFNPDKGVLVLEVKGGTISYNDGKWYQNDHEIEPVQQAITNKYALMEMLRGALNRKPPVVFAHAICFPDCKSKDAWPPEAEGLVLTGDMFQGVESFANRVIDSMRPPFFFPEGRLSTEEMIDALSPCFEYGVSLQERIMREERIFSDLKARQYSIVSAMRNYKRLLVSCTPGSGEASLAAAKAIELSGCCRNVLLLGYTKMLAKSLKRMVKKAQNVTAYAFFEYCIDVMKISRDVVKKYELNPKLYEKLSLGMRQYAEDHAICYDAIVVVEGQDFSAEMWNALNNMVDLNGYLYVFYESDHDVFKQNGSLPDFGYPPVIIDFNCRMTKRICAETERYCENISRCHPDSPEGSEVVDRSGDCRQMLAEELDRIVNQEHVASADVVVLGAHDPEHMPSLRDGMDINGFHLVRGQANGAFRQISYYTHMKFKGCESKVVILLDVDEQNDPRWNRAGMSAAISRATHHLVILRHGHAGGGK